MATEKQRAAAKKNIEKARKKWLSMPSTQRIRVRPAERNQSKSTDDETESVLTSEDTLLHQQRKNTPTSSSHTKPGHNEDRQFRKEKEHAHMGSR